MMKWDETMSLILADVFVLRQITRNYCIPNESPVMPGI
jgi:hypothetical protein